MNICGHYRIYAGEVQSDGWIEIRLHDVNDQGRTVTMRVKDLGPIRIGGEVEVVSFGKSDLNT